MPTAQLDSRLSPNDKRIARAAAAVEQGELAVAHATDPAARDAALLLLAEARVELGHALAQRQAWR